MSMTVAALAAAYLIRFHSGLVPLHEGGIPPLSGYLNVLPFALLIASVVYYSCSLYSPRRVGRIFSELVDILKATLMTGGAFAAATFFYRDFFFSRAVLVIFCGTNLLFLSSSRVLLRSLLRWVRSRGRNLRYAIIVGSGRLGQRVADAIEKNPWTGIQVAGFVDDAPDKIGRLVRRIPVLGRIDQASAIVSVREINMVFIALPFEKYSLVEDLVKSLTKEIADVRIVPDVAHLCRLALPVSDLDGLAMLNAQASPLVGWNSVLKRASDIAVSILVLFLLSPVLVLIALAIKLTSRGPVLFRQVRMGYDGKEFSIYKFRTMRDSNGDEPTPAWTSDGDPRRTALGILLRRTSLDELPQFFNVLRGEMSIVGPRPERPILIREFRDQVPLYMLRHKIKAGITGWAQINGWRGDTSLRKRVQYDLYYLRNWSIWFDFWIMILTPFRGLVHKNAY